MLTKYRDEKFRQKQLESAPKRGNHPNWQGGITPADQQFRDSHEGRRWRKRVLERDDHACRRCGAVDCKLAHHIGSLEDYPELAYEVSNGLTMCSSCHRKVHIYVKAGAFDLLIIPETDHPVWRF